MKAFRNISSFCTRFTACLMSLQKAILARLTAGINLSLSCANKVFLGIFIYLAFRTFHEFNLLLFNAENGQISNGETSCPSHFAFPSKDVRANYELQAIRDERVRLDEMVSKLQTQCASSVQSFEMSVKENDREQYMDALRDLLVNEYETLRIQRIGKPDYALGELGAKVVDHSETYKYGGKVFQVMGLPLFWEPKTPDIVLSKASESIVPGQCWPFDGAMGHVTIQLSRSVNVTSVSYEHVSARLMPSDEMRNAPKIVEVWLGMNEDVNRRIGHFDYELRDYGAHTLWLKHGGVPARFVKFYVLENYGEKFTCLYRFRVHGNPL